MPRRLLPLSVESLFASLGFVVFCLFACCSNAASLPRVRARKASLILGCCCRRARFPAVQVKACGLAAQSVGRDGEMRWETVFIISFVVLVNIDCRGVDVRFVCLGRAAHARGDAACEPHGKTILA